MVTYQLQSQFQRFLYQTLCELSQIKDIKHIERKFHSVPWVMSKWWDLGVLGVKNLSMGICDGAPTTVSLNDNSCYATVIILGIFLDPLNK